MPDKHPQDRAADSADEAKQAPGAPGEPAHWAPADKTGVGTALNPVSPVWFTLCRGVVTEVYYPYVDTACTRFLGLLVADGKDFFSDEACDAASEVHYLTPGVPAYRLVNTCNKGRYRIEKDILSDPRRPVLLHDVHFMPRHGRATDYRVYALLNPHIGNQGAGATAWAGDFKGVPMLFARRGGIAVALACSPPWRARSVGFVGHSDGRRDVARHKKMTWRYDRAEDGNVALTGEVDLAADGRFALALGFGRNEWEAGHQARAALLQGFHEARREYVRGWTDWVKGLLALKGSHGHPQDVYRISAAVMRIHEARFFAGGIIASLAVPWGPARGDGDMGYHVVWPRDMIQTVAALLAVWRHEDARRVLFYFRVTQEADGHWPQNMRLDGEAWWRGIQLDETAFVVLLVGLACREKALDDDALKFLWPMVRRAAGYLVRHGPVTPMDRWEEVPGYYVSTLAVEIAALLVAADIADELGEPDPAAYLRETADVWNDSVERMLYATGTDLGRRAGVDGYYVRFANPDQRAAPSPAHGDVTIVNHPPGERERPAASVVSPDALTLVRFGLRAADDPRIVNTLRVIDMLCKTDTPRGPCWHRYNDDGYGEHADGSPFDGTGVGRLWPLLAGERGHYELAAGRPDEAERMVQAMEAFANDSGLLPEQVWDSDDIPERGLFKGRPTGSAMPLVWAHAEYVKLRRSLHDGKVFDMPEATVQRYLRDKVHSPHFFWRIDQKCRSMPAGKVLRVELKGAALVRWSADGWASSKEIPTRDTGLGVHVADLPTAKLRPGADVVFTFHWAEEKRWQGEDFHVAVLG